MSSGKKKQTLQEKFNLTPSRKQRDISPRIIAILQEISDRYDHALKMGKLFLHNSKQRFRKKMG